MAFGLHRSTEHAECVFEKLGEVVGLGSLLQPSAVSSVAPFLWPELGLPPPTQLCVTSLRSVKLRVSGIHIGNRRRDLTTATEALSAV
jgi:hypothetical protein